jgi:hypothetical protein
MSESKVSSLSQPLSHSLVQAASGLVISSSGLAFDYKDFQCARIARVCSVYHVAVYLKGHDCEPLCSVDFDSIEAVTPVFVDVMKQVEAFKLTASKKQ